MASRAAVGKEWMTLSVQGEGLFCVSKILSDGKWLQQAYPCHLLLAGHVWQSFVEPIELCSFRIQLLLLLHPSLQGK